MGEKMARKQKPLIWKRPVTWMPVVEEWLRPLLGRNAIARLRREDVSELYADDPDWLAMLEDVLRPGVFEVAEKFARDLEGKVVRAYHGCRTEDAGQYFRNGIRAHRREELESQVRELVHADPRLAWLRNGLEARMAEFESALDQGRCYVVLDDRSLLDGGAHYLIYGSEWICAVLGHGYREPLLENGAPTLVSVDLPLSWVSNGLRKELAELLLGEWARQTLLVPKRVFVEDFTFTMSRDLPPQTVVGHRHPKKLVDPLERMRVYRPATTTCLHCERSAAERSSSR